MCLVGPRTFVRISWICKCQTAVSDSSSEAEVISLDAALRMEGLPSLMLWETILDVFPMASVQSFGKSPPRKASAASDALAYAPRELPDLYGKLMGDVDYVPCTLPLSCGRGK